MPTQSVGRLAICLAVFLTGSAHLASGASTLAAPANPGDTNIKVLNTTGFTAPSTLVIDVGASTEVVTATIIGSSTKTTTLAAAAAAGSTNVKVASVTLLVVGDTVTIDTGASTETAIISAVGTAGAVGTGVTLTAPLSSAHASGGQFKQPGTGITFTPALTLSHAIGASVTTCTPPPTPTITPGGPTTFCTGGSVTLTSSSASGNQWFLDGNPIGGATANTYIATAGGDYTVVVTASGCSSAPSAATTVTVDPIPPTPTITPGGPTTFCAGGSVTLTSSSASGNQWFLNGNPIGGATSNTFVATASGDYTVVVTSNGCSSAPSPATTVTVNPTPPTPTITPGGPTTFCTGGSVTLTSSSASGSQWFLNGNPIGGATSNTHVATASGDYTVVVTSSGCPSAPSSATTVTVNPIPPTPTITPGGPTTFCTGGSVTLTSSSASGNQWFLNGNPIGGATSNSFIATAAGDYTVLVTSSGCPSAPSSATTVTVNPIPPTPTITPGGPTTFCTGGSVTLTSSSASGNQWSLNGNPIGGATSNTYIATASGNYTVVVTTSGCSSAPSAATTVMVNPNPDATITSPPTTTAGAPGTASVANAGAGATYSWSITGGSINSGAGTESIGFTAGAVGTMTLQVTVTTSAGCSDTKSLNVTVAAPTVTMVTPGTGPMSGGTIVTIQGNGFQNGATVTFGGLAATSVIVNSANQITATSPAHAPGAVDVVVTNPDTTTATLAGAFVYAATSAIPMLDWRVLVLLAIALSFVGARMGS